MSLSASGPIAFDPPATYAVLLRPSICVSQGECDDGVFCNAVAYDDGRPAPPAGSAWWYLVRSRNSCGAGSYGTPLRDAGILVCP